MAKPSRPSAPQLADGPDPVHQAVLHVFRQAGVVMPVEDRERFATAIAQRAGALRDVQFRAAMGQLRAVADAVPAPFQALAVRPSDGLVDLAGAVSLMALHGQTTEAKWLEALKALHAARVELELNLASGILPPSAQAALDQITALAPEPPPAPTEAETQVLP